MTIPFEDYDALLNSRITSDIWGSLLLTHVNSMSTKFASDLQLQPEFGQAIFLKGNLLYGLSIGEIGVLYEYHLATTDHTFRKVSGAYFTPDDISEFLAAEAQEFPTGTWIDPCCGVGNLSFHFLNMSQSPAQALSRLTLMDINPQALLIARTLLCAYFDPSINTWRSVKALNQNFLDYEIKEDYVLMNPPYVGVKADPRFRSSTSRDLYAYFIEKAAGTKGFISITPQSFTNAVKFSSLRKLLLTERSGADIYCFDNIPGCVFKGIKFGSQNSNTANSVRAAIIVSAPESKEWRITPLLRWLRRERSELISNLKTFLSPAPFTESIFPKISKNLLPAYEKLSIESKLKDQASDMKTPYALRIPTSPRYFIPATKRDLNRSSLATVYFPDENTMMKWYLVLNSSVLYWWWRVMDGGMTLSLTTLYSCPMPSSLDSMSIETLTGLVAEVEQSEQENLVVKMNAGKGNESVKHSSQLINKVTTAIVPDYAQFMALEHNNSHLR